MQIAYIIGAYFILMLGMAWYFSRHESLETYFVNARKTKLWMMTFSTVATVVGAGATVAIVTEVHRTGISYGLALPASLIFGMILMGLFAKRIRSAGEKYKAHTLVDFYGTRFDRKNKILTGIVQLFLQCIWMGIQTVALAALMQAVLDINPATAILLTVGITIIYTAMGGLKLDIITDFVQFWIILITFISLGVIGYMRLDGGFSGLITSLPAGHLDPFAFGGMSWLVGALLLSGFIYIGNSMYWQRIFAAENAETAAKSFYWSIPFIAVLSALVLFFGLLSTTTLPGIDPQTAIFELFSTLLGPALAGLGIAALLAVLMSSIDSMVVAGSTILYKEFYDEKTHSIVRARLLTAGFGMLGGIVAFALPNIVTLSLLVTYLALIFVPSSLAGLYSKRISANASFYSILIPAAALPFLFPFLDKNTFLITTPLSAAILFLYDPLTRKVKKRKK